MNARLLELIDVNTIETMAEQFYKLTNISHQLLDQNMECVFSFGMNQEENIQLTKIEIPIFYMSNTLDHLLFVQLKMTSVLVINTSKCFQISL